MLQATAKNRLFLEIAQVWVAVTFANLLLFSFHIIVGRGLGPQDYSLFGALFGIVLLTNALVTAVAVAVAKLVASSDEEDTGHLITSALFQMSVLGVVLLVAFGLASPLIASYLHTASLVPVLATGAIISVSLVLPVATGALQGMQRFTWFSASQIIHGGSRLAFGGAALAIGFGTTGVLAAIGLASLLTTGIGLMVLKLPIELRLRALPVSGMAKLLLPTLIGTLVISFPTSVDVIIVRHFFSSSDAGLYTGASVLGRIVLFVSVAVTLVLFPKMAGEWARGRSAHGLLYKGLAITALLSGTLSLAFVILPELALSLFLGSEFKEAHSLVALYAGAMFFYSLAVVFLSYWLATGQMGYIYFLLLPHMVLNLALVYAFHQSTSQVVLMLLSVSVSLVILSLIAMAATKRRAPDDYSPTRSSLSTISGQIPKPGGP